MRQCIEARVITEYIECRRVRQLNPRGSIVNALSEILERRAHFAQVCICKGRRDRPDILALFILVKPRQYLPCLALLLG